MHYKQFSAAVASGFDFSWQKGIKVLDGSSPGGGFCADPAAAVPHGAKLLLYKPMAGSQTDLTPGAEQIVGLPSSG